MKKLILLLLFILLVFSCLENHYSEGECFVSPDPDRVCIEEYQPVCACNGLVYGN